jgi:Protein of unknown function (DUF3592)
MPVRGRGRGRGRRPGRAVAGQRVAGQRFGPKHIVALVLGVGLGVALLAGGLDRWHAHRVLASRGVTTNALITAVHSGRGGTSVDVRFAAPGGQEITARVEDAQSPDGLHEGGTIAVRYDPLDPAGRVESAQAGSGVATAWLLILGGALLLALAAYGTAWWILHGLGR